MDIWINLRLLDVFNLLIGKRVDVMNLNSEDEALIGIKKGQSTYYSNVERGCSVWKIN
ncbi:hypothetical protein [Brevibacillus sp. NRS-1366]|uniref:hypothetical protein n=1 Tax=Brevibacillus sp. NRS-1366 TaxID=3233899 RepID=UPI003D218C05